MARNAQECLVTEELDEDSREQPFSAIRGAGE
jgi:hypothetical protein